MTNLKGTIQHEQKLKGNIETQNKLNAKLSERTPLSGTSDYERLRNKPQINGIELLKNKTAKDLFLQEFMIPVSNEEIDNMFK